MYEKKAPALMIERRGLEKTRQYLLSRKCNIIGSSRFTTVFGMGTGMAKSLWSPGRRAGERCDSLDVVVVKSMNRGSSD